jgi:hypothetical protein
MNLSTQFLPVDLPPHFLHSLSVNSCTFDFEGSMQHRDSLSTRCTITSSSSFVRFYVFGLQLHQEHCLAHWSTTVIQGTL